MEVPEPIDKSILNIIQCIYSQSPEQVEICICLNMVLILSDTNTVIISSNQRPRGQTGWTVFSGWHLRGRQHVL